MWPACSARASAVPNYFSNFDGYVNLDQFRKLVNPHTGNPWDMDLDFDAYRGLNTKGERIMAAMRSVHTYYFYNQDIFDEVGVAPPTSWDGFADVCTTLDAAGYIPLTINYIWQAPQWLAEIYFDQYHVNWIEQVRAQPGEVACCMTMRPSTCAHAFPQTPTSMCNRLCPCSQATQLSQL